MTTMMLGVAAAMRERVCSNTVWPLLRGARNFVAPKRRLKPAANTTAPVRSDVVRGPAFAASLILFYACVSRSVGLHRAGSVYLMQYSLAVAFSVFISSRYLDDKGLSDLVYVISIKVI